MTRLLFLIFLTWNVLMGDGVFIAPRLGKVPEECVHPIPHGAILKEKPLSWSENGFF